LILFVGSPRSVAGCIVLPRSLPSLYLQTPTGNRDVVVGPFWIACPPPDGVWYNANQFGFDLIQYDIDFFDKDRSRGVYHSALHSKSEGVIFPMCTFTSGCPNFGPITPGLNVWRDGTTTAPIFTSRSLPTGQYVPRFLEQSPVIGEPILECSDVMVNVRTGPPPPPQWWLDPWNTNGVFVFNSDRMAILDQNRVVKFGTSEFHSVNGSQPIYNGGAFGAPYCRLRMDWKSTIQFLRIRNTGSSTLQVECSTRYQYGINEASAALSNYDQTFVEILPLSVVSGNPSQLSRIPPREAARKYYTTYESLIRPEIVRDRIRVRTQALINIEDTFDMNNIENFVQLPGLARCVRTIVDGIKAVKNLNFRAAVKFMADLYLIYKYVFLTTAGDVDKARKRSRSIINKLDDPGNFRTRRRATEVVKPSIQFRDITKLEVRCSTEYKLRLVTDHIAYLVHYLETLGVFPSAANLWDLVPFSFVIDWFLNLSDVFEALRLDRDTQNYQLLARIESQKYQFRWTKDLLSDVFGPRVSWDSPIEASLYRRVIKSSWGQTDPLALAGSQGIGWSQFVTGGALVLQRI